MCSVSEAKMTIAPIFGCGTSRRQPPSIVVPDGYIPARQRAPAPLFPGFLSALRNTSTLMMSAARQISSMYDLPEGGC